MWQSQYFTLIIKNMERLIGHKIKSVITTLFNDGKTRVSVEEGLVTSVEKIGDKAWVYYRLHGFDEDFKCVFDAKDLTNEYLSHTSVSLFFEFEDYSDIVNTIITL